MRIFALLHAIIYIFTFIYCLQHYADMFLTVFVRFILLTGMNSNKISTMPWLQVQWCIPEMLLGIDQNVQILYNAMNLNTRYMH